MRKQNTIIILYKNIKLLLFWFQMYEWTGVTEKLVELKLKNCEEYCLVDDYISIVKPSLATDDDMLCLFKNKNATELQKLLDPQT